MGSRLVLASSSAYRVAVLAAAGIDVAVVAPTFDEDTARHLFAALGAEQYALELARRKARSVLDGVGDEAMVIGADQVGVRVDDGSDVEIGKPPTLAAAVEQLMAVSGRSFRLINGIVVVRSGDGAEFAAVDRHVVHMARFDLAAAQAYVERYRPLDCVGGCRIEDPSNLVARVEGSGRDGVMGMPVAVLESLVGQACHR